MTLLETKNLLFLQNCAYAIFNIFTQACFIWFFTSIYDDKNSNVIFRQFLLINLSMKCKWIIQCWNDEDQMQAATFIRWVDDTSFDGIVFWPTIIFEKQLPISRPKVAKRVTTRRSLTNFINSWGWKCWILEV